MDLDPSTIFGKLYHSTPNGIELPVLNSLSIDTSDLKSKKNVYSISTVKDIGWYLSKNIINQRLGVALENQRRI